MDSEQIRISNFNYALLWKSLEEVIVPDELRGKGYTVFDEVLRWEQHDCKDEECPLTMARDMSRSMAAGMLSAMQLAYIIVAETMQADASVMSAEQQIERIDAAAKGLVVAKKMFVHELDDKVQAMASLRALLVERIQEAREQTEAEKRCAETQHWMDEVEEKA